MMILETHRLVRRNVSQLSCIVWEVEWVDSAGRFDLVLLEPTMPEVEDYMFHVSRCQRLSGDAI